MSVDSLFGLQVLVLESVTLCQGSNTFGGQSGGAPDVQKSHQFSMQIFEKLGQQFGDLCPIYADFET
jgi:hypothetical protein